MNVKKFIVSLGVGAGVLFWGLDCLAEESLPPPEAPVEEAPVTETAVKRSKGVRTREKEAEGTRAPNRFETDPVIKSRYEYNGEPLEVDPD